MNRSVAPRPATRSWWMEEALSHDAFVGPDAPPLDRDTTADVVVLGGGYTGMWTAWFLKEREPDLDIVLLEADICGGGPSGRNGGFCDGWWGHLSDLLQTYGEADALELLMTMGRSPGEIGAWAERHGADVWFRHAGDLAVATSPAQDHRFDGLIETAARLGVEDEYAILTADEVRERCDSPVFRGGLLIHDAANVQPARLARALRNVLLDRGVRIHEGTRVTRFRAGSPVIAETPNGAVRAADAVVGLGAWATWWRPFRPITTVRGSYIVITEPAPDRLKELGWTGGQQIRDLRSSIHYARTTPDGRIALGLGGLQPDLARRIDHRYDYVERYASRVARDLVRLFPAFEGVSIEAAWGGPINVSGFTMPFFGTMGRHRNVHYGLGYTGNGVAPSHLGGKILAALATRADDGFTRLGVVTREPKRFPPEPIRSPGMLI
ncbi:MAG TPA: FAD-dependent oxidoreductase, partial [Actinomycetota bacterium]|nr:FAD-dependent oxidoreductase [Actinomycetota bacterium]